MAQILLALIYKEYGVVECLLENLKTKDLEPRASRMKISLYTFQWKVIMLLVKMKIIKYTQHHQDLELVLDMI